ncbi:copper chaperone PCu(A)C [Castellaniella caeni]
MGAVARRETGSEMNQVSKSVLGAFASLLLSSAAFSAQHAAGQATPVAELPVSVAVTASDCWIRQIPAPAPSGGFLVFHNQADQAAVLTGVSSPDYADVMMHETTHENGMSKMSMVHQVSVPAGGQLDFKPGSYHLMLEQARDGLKVGDHVAVDFLLADGHRVSAQCEIKSPKAMSGMGHMQHMKH